MSPSSPDVRRVLVWGLKPRMAEAAAFPGIVRPQLRVGKRSAVCEWFQKAIKRASIMRWCSTAVLLLRDAKSVLF